MPTTCGHCTQDLEGGSEAAPWEIQAQGPRPVSGSLSVGWKKSPVSCPESCLVILAPAFHKLGVASELGEPPGAGLIDSWTVPSFRPDIKPRAGAVGAHSHCCVARPEAQGWRGGGLPGRKVLCSRAWAGGQPAAWRDGAAQNFHGASQVWQQCSERLFQLFGQPGSTVPGARCDRGSVTPEHRSQHAAGGLAAGQHSPCGSDSRKDRGAQAGRGNPHPGAPLCAARSPGPAPFPENTASLYHAGGTLPTGALAVFFACGRAGNSLSRGKLFHGTDYTCWSRPVEK